MMKFYINGKFLCQQKTGVQAYAFGMLDALLKVGFEFVVLVPKSFENTFNLPLKKIGITSSLAMWEQVSLCNFIRKDKEAILINFCNSAPLFLKNQVITIHDLAFEVKNVNWFSYFFKTWYRFLIPRICNNSKLILAISEFSKREICLNYHIKANKVKIIPNGLPFIADITKAITDKKYVLLIGGNNPRKNNNFVLNQISAIQNLGYYIVVLSNNTSVFINNSETVHPSVRNLNYMENDEYYSLIRNASALIYPSIYEGFGIPILEALCLKTLVICSDLPVFKESFGEGPIYFKNNDNNSFLAALKKIETAKVSEEYVENLKKIYNFKSSANLFISELKCLESQ